MFKALTLDSSLPRLPLDKVTELGSICPFVRASEKGLGWLVLKTWFMTLFCYVKYHETNLKGNVEPGIS